MLESAQWGVAHNTSSSPEEPVQPDTRIEGEGESLNRKNEINTMKGDVIWQTKYNEQPIAVAPAGSSTRSTNE